MVAPGHLWASEEDAVNYIKVVSRVGQAGQYKVIKLIDVNSIKIYEHASREGSDPIQVGEVANAEVAC